MIVGILQVELAIPEAGSLKDKRSVIRSLKDHLHRDLKLAAAEIAHQDDPATGAIGVAVIATDGKRAGEALDHASELCRRQVAAEVVSTKRWIVRMKDLVPQRETTSLLDTGAITTEMLAHLGELDEADLTEDSP